MSDSEEFARYAKAERQLCEQAGPLLVAIIRGIERRAGLRITEVRLTFDHANLSSDSIAANCTIVHAHDCLQSKPYEPAAEGNLSSNRE
jgi:hypothetical protein